ncbi:MAG: hypothetical protein OXU98_00670, partial [Gammaproteobacteria bacterium]|nr:hypothetical protein [Gammaproteobacteria bacterium]
MRTGDWTPVQWFNPNLPVIASEMDSLPHCVRGDTFAWLPSQPRVPENFDYELSEKGDLFCTISEDIMQTISATPESKGTVKPGRERLAEKYWQYADHVLVAIRFRTTTSRLTAVYSECPALGSAFRPIGVNDKDTAKAYAAFLNSTFGVIQLLNRRSKTLTYAAYETGHMRTLMLPDPATADLAPLLDAFEQVKNTPLQRLSQCAQDPARQTLDHAAAQTLGVAPAQTDQWRKWLS